MLQMECSSKISKWPCLRSQALKSMLIRPFEFSENLEDFYVKCYQRARSCSPTTFSIQIFLTFFKNSNRHKISFFNARDFKLGYFDVFGLLFPFLAFLKQQPIILLKEGHVTTQLQRAYDPRSRLYLQSGDQCTSYLTKANSTKTVGKHVGKQLATIRPCLYSR